MHIDLKKLEAAGWETNLDVDSGTIDIYPRHGNELGAKVAALVERLTDLSAIETEQAVMEFTRRVQQFQLLKLFD